MIYPYYHNFHLYTAPSFRQLRILRQYLLHGQNIKIEALSRRILLNLPQKNNIILDVGGNIGYSSIFYSSILDSISGFCFSFEPHPYNLKHMRTNLASYSNCYILPFGLSNSSSIL